MSAWAGQPWANYAIEGVIGVLAIVSIALLFLLRQPEPPQEPDELAPTVETIPLEAIKPVKIEDEVKSDKLDDSRYSG